MSLSSRQSRITIYGYSDTGVAGVVVDTWTALYTRWGNAADLRGRQRMVGTAAQHEVDVAIEFSDEVAVPDDALLGVNGVYYHARYAERKPRLRKIVVYAQRASTDVLVLDTAALNYDAFTTYGGAYTFNGVHAVQPS